MTALSPAQMRAMRSIAAIDPVAKRWEVLHERAGELALMAGLAAEKDGRTQACFAQQFEAAGEWQRTMAAQGIDDIAAMLRVGMQALRVIEARGSDASAPALALWREFHAARAAVLALVEPYEAAKAA